MRLYWIHLWRSKHYRLASAEERRLIEIRYSLARTLQLVRRREKITQKALAKRLGVAQSSISRAERASNYVSLDIAVRCLIVLGCSDDKIAAACDPSKRQDIQLLRRRAQEPGYPAPRPADVPAPPGEHRFLRKGTQRLIRLR